MIRSSAVHSIKERLSALRLYNLSEESLISAELLAYDATFIVLEEMLAEIGRDAFVQTAGDRALRRFVSLVGLPPRSDVSASSRRELVIYRMSVARYDFTALRMLSSARAAGIEAEIIEDPPGERLRVNTIDLIDPALTNTLARERLESLLPAHLAWELIFGISTWNHFEALGLTWEEGDALSLPWDAIDMKIQQLLGMEG